MCRHSVFLVISIGIKVMHYKASIFSVLKLKLFLVFTRPLNHGIPRLRLGLWLYGLDALVQPAGSHPLPNTFPSHLRTTTAV
jgi:hypothetical protein